MTDPQRVEQLLRILDSLSALSQGNVDWRRDLDYREVNALRNILKLAQASGIVTADLEIPDDLLSGELRVHPAVFFGYVSATKNAIARELSLLGYSESGTAASIADIDPKTVFIVHGHDHDAKEMIRTLMVEVRLNPIDFDDVRRSLKRPRPFIGEMVEYAFQLAQAAVVLYTPDTEVRTSAKLLPEGVDPTVTYQPRANVLLESGIALVTHPDRFVIIEFGEAKLPSDLQGRHVARWTDDTPELRSDFLDRLEACGCQPTRGGSRWMKAGKRSDPTWQ